MKFRYTARTDAGRVFRGSIDAPDRGEAEAVLAQRGYLAVGLREQPRAIEAVQDFLLQLQRPRTKDVVVFLRQFSVMVSAKMPIVQALRALAYETESPALRGVIVDLVKDVESGTKLSDALASHPRVFDSFAVHLIRAGETSGRLEDVLSYLADQAEHDEELRGKVRGAMVYPSFILGGLGTVAFIMMTFVVPKLTNVLQETGAELPIATRMLIGVSSFFAAWWWLLIVVIVAAFVSFRYALRYPTVRASWDATKLRLPVAGGIARDVAVVRFTRSFAMLLQGGVDVVPALEVVRGVLGNEAFRSLIDETIREVRDGNSISSVLRDSPFVPSMVSQLLSVGEETGQLEEVLERLGSHHERLLEAHIRNLVTIIEPAVMVVLGVAVGIMVAAVIMPMYNLASQF